MSDTTASPKRFTVQTVGRVSGVARTRARSRHVAHELDSEATGPETA